MEKRELPKLRTTNQLYEDIHTSDPESPISKSFIKRIIVQNKIPFIAVGVKKMYDEEVVFEHIRNAFATDEDEENNLKNFM